MTALLYAGSPLDRAAAVLRAAGIEDPYEDDAWVKTIGVKIGDVPPLGLDDIGRARS